ncbi:hypothetical protein BD410DRAFT_793499 [Rickenella mellea]|uniref:RanBP2-type domain-containing protein n=1 Tax=Rickenella mellea TaxID=50990 RepID=A0A4Y7PRY9_9AGAM|nr:hypothetical protein BD410DRAFT_793499 [Rickenella mellea]
MESHSNVAEELEVVRHEQYYFSLITFRVENCLFKLPRHFVEQSEVFQGMYAVAQADTKEGTCDEHPIYLPQTSRKDFEAFLKVAIPTSEGGPRKALPCEDWQAVLELAHKWDFKNTRQLAIEALDNLSMDLVEKITVIQKYDIKDWACAAYETLVAREEALTAKEMKSLGFEFTSKMAEAREKLMKKKINESGNALSQWYCSPCGFHNYSRDSCEDCGLSKPSIDELTVIRGVIHEVFGDPICIL